MLIYIINFLLLLLYGLFIKNKKAFTIIASIQLFLILALRAPTVGPDLVNYGEGFEYIAGLSLGDMLSRLHLIETAELVYPFSYESGYVVFNWIIGALGFNFHGFLIIHAAICVAVIGRFVYKYSEDVHLSFLLFISLGFFTYLFGILRQMLAMTLFLLAIPYIRERKLLKYLLLCFLAFTIHRVAIIVVPLYFIYNVKITRKRYVKLCLCLAGLLAISPLLAKYVISPILHLIGKTSYQLHFSLNMYIILMLLIAVMILIFASFEELFEENPENNFLCWAFLLAIAIEIMGLYNDVIARAMYIPYVAVIALVPNVLKRYKHTGIAVIGKALVVVLLFAFMMLQLVSSPINPYIFCFA